MAAGNVVLAGATGNLGMRIARSLRARGANVRALVRFGTPAGKLERLLRIGVNAVEVDWGSPTDVARACSGADCVTSGLSGLHDVVIDAQTALLEGAVEAGVPRFIPSDYSIDFTKLVPGTNRNLDLRRAFHERLESANIAATTIFNGAFAELLAGKMPLVLYKLERILYWGEDADQPLDFTTMDNAAAYTANASLDPVTPRYLRIAGDRVSARDLAAMMTELTGRKFELLRAGSLDRLETLIKIARWVPGDPENVYPAWQGMQYMRDMFSGRALGPLDNGRYRDVTWTSVYNVLAHRLRHLEPSIADGPLSVRSMRGQHV